MKADALKAMWERLAAAGMVTGDAPVDAVITPWYVRTMLGFAGWIGALFLFGFVAFFLFAALESAGGALLTGVLLCGAAWFLLGRQTNEFAIQFGLAVSMAGQAMMGFGLMESLGGSGAGRFLAVAAAETAVALLLPNAINRFAATVAAMTFVALALAAHNAVALAPALATAGFALFWLCEFRVARHGAVLRPIAYGLVVSAIAFDLSGLWPFWNFFGHAYYGEMNDAFMLLADRAGLLLQGATLLLVAWRLLVREGTGKRAMTATLAVTLLLAVLLSPAPGVVTALVAMVLGFAQRNRLLTGLGLLAAIAYLGSYYYQLEATLLEKAQVLFATGLVLLIARALVLRFWPEQVVSGDEHA